MVDGLRAELRAPSVKDFMQLRALMGWGLISERQAALSIERSLAFAVIYEGEQLLAMGRLVGDGALFFYLQDIVVHPEYQRRGLGREVMRQLEIYLSQVALPGATVGLLAAKGNEAFYTEFGYRLRDGEQLGFGLCRYVS